MSNQTRRYYSRLLLLGRGNNPSLCEASRDLSAAVSRTVPFA